MSPGNINILPIPNNLKYWILYHNYIEPVYKVFLSCTEDNVFYHI